MEKPISFYEFIKLYKWDFSLLFKDSEFDFWDNCSYFALNAQSDRKFPKSSLNKEEIKSYISTAVLTKFVCKSIREPYPSTIFEKLWDKYASMCLA